jgi:hypothetical protein
MQDLEDKLTAAKERNNNLRKELNMPLYTTYFFPVLCRQTADSYENQIAHMNNEIKSLEELIKIEEKIFYDLNVSKLYKYKSLIECFSEQCRISDIEQTNDTN